MQLLPLGISPKKLGFLYIVERLILSKFEMLKIVKKAVEIG